jgi:hypothetical protein
MRNIVLCISIIVTFSPLYSAEKQENFLDHQYYDADVGQALEAIQFVLNDCDIGVLGADETAGIVVSRVYEVGESESDLLEGYEEGGAFFVVLVVYVAPSSPGVVEVDVTTLLHAKRAARGSLMERGFVGGNSASQRVYSGLEGYLGKGHLRYLGS